MSGIVAVFDRRGVGVDREEFKSMLGSIEHRGPHGSGIWCDDGIALGYQHLQSTPESTFDDQPYQGEEIVVIADVRLDNRPELLQRLPTSEAGHKIPDSRLVAKSYERWGTQCVDELVGVFAFVVWDRSRDRIFCARDHAGIKPFYYVNNEDLLLIASEKKALLAHPATAGELDEVKIGEYLLDSYTSKERSYFESIRRLPPAHAVRVSVDGIQRWQYWDLDPTRTITLSSDAAYERRFRELFETAVERRLRGIGPIGTALSGGIDSSLVTVMSRKLLDDSEPLHTFSNIYDDAPSTDEREYIEAVLEQGAYESHYIDDTDTNLLVDDEVLRTYFDQPIRNQMHFAGMERIKRAKQEGVGIILGGEQGDTTIGYGFARLPQLLWTGHWLELYHELQSIGTVLGMDPTNHFMYDIIPSVVPDPMFRLRRTISGRGEMVSDVNPTIRSAFIDRTNLESRYLDSQKGSILPKGPRRIHRDALLKPSLVESYEERDLLSAAFGVEKRYPFTDKRLVEFCLAMPCDQQFRDGWPRSIARRAMGDMLPDEVRFRWQKAAGNEAFQNALENELPRLESVIEDTGLVTEYIDADALRATLKQFSSGSNSHASSALWRALSLSVWLDRVSNG